MSLTAEHQQLLELASRVPQDQISTARKMLEALIVDPFWLSLASAPMDDEELTPEAAAAVLEAEKAVGNGKAISHDEMLREFGLK
jgi:hypothetical protein